MPIRQKGALQHELHSYASDARPKALHSCASDARPEALHSYAPDARPEGKIGLPLSSA